MQEHGVSRCRHEERLPRATRVLMLVLNARASIRTVYHLLHSFFVVLTQVYHT